MLSFSYSLVNFFSLWLVFYFFLVTLGGVVVILGFWFFKKDLKVEWVERGRRSGRT